MSGKRPTKKIITAALYFANISRDANAIAEFIDANVRTIKRYAEEPEWTETLILCQYKGPRSFLRQPSRDVRRDTPELFTEVRDIYFHAAHLSEPIHTLPRIVEETLGKDVVTRRKVGDWAHRYGWREQVTDIQNPATPSD